MRKAPGESKALSSFGLGFGGTNSPEMHRGWLYFFFLFTFLGGDLAFLGEPDAAFSGEGGFGFGRVKALM